jgi:cytochrome c553
LKSREREREKEMERERERKRERERGREWQKKVIICVACHQQKKLSAENNPLLLMQHAQYNGASKDEQGQEKIHSG